MSKHSYVMGTLITRVRRQFFRSR